MTKTAAEYPNDSQDSNSPFGVLVHSFFVIPFLLAVLSVLLFTAVRILTMEQRTVYDYLNDIKIGGLTKRWQSAFELSRILASPKLVPQDQKFSDDMTRIFTEAQKDDPRVRQYLALAMARTGNPRFIDPLIKALPGESDENLYAIIDALGVLKARAAVPELLKYLEDDNAHIRLVTVMALGQIGDRSTVDALKKRLNDPEPNVQWDAAIALAKMGDATAKGLLLNLLDRRYLAQFQQVDPMEQTHIMLVTIEATAGLNNPDINNRLQNLFRTDKNMNVRRSAFDALQTNHQPVNQ